MSPPVGDEGSSMKSCADLDIDRRAEWLRLSDAIEKNPDVLVIGGGVIGVCAAYALSTRQKRVVVIDAGSIGAGSSYGNAGLIVPSHSLPLAVPGVIGKGLRWMLDKESPFYIRPRADSALFSWLLKFRAAATESEDITVWQVREATDFSSNLCYVRRTSVRKTLI